MMVVRHSIIYIYIYDRFYQKIYLYICITCTICSIVKYQQTKKELKGKHKINGKIKIKPKPPKHLVLVGATNRY